MGLVSVPNTAYIDYIMDYILIFLNGIITFISPCLLPMLPVYVSYFAGGEEERTLTKTLKNALGFVAGFTVVFVALGAFAGAIGGFLNKYEVVVNIVTGLIVVFFGLNIVGILKLNIFKGINASFLGNQLGFFSAILFGMVFAIGWTPCLSAYLGAALLYASQQGDVLKGVLMLVCYSLGLGIPFLMSSLLINKLKGAFNFIKRHYNVINIVCGSLLCVVGVLMMFGFLDAVLFSLTGFFDNIF